MRITVPQIMRAIPSADRARVTEFVDTFNSYGEGFGINTTARVIHFIAQCAHESGSFKLVEENLNYSADGLLRTWPSRFTKATAAQYARQPEKIANKVYANRMGNGNEASGDGWKYRGRGFIQCTGKATYAAYQNSGFCVGNLLAHPEWLTKAPGHTKSAMWFWWKNGLNELADQDTGQRVIDGEAVVTMITKKVNGGVNGLSNRKLLYRKLRKEFSL